MKFLLDQDVFAVTGRFLSALGHDVQTASAMDLSSADDSVLLEQAQKQDRIVLSPVIEISGAWSSFVARGRVCCTCV